VIEAGGVGYAVSVSSHTFRELPGDGEPVFLRTRQVVREDALMLFGFTREEELRLFDLVIGVSGVGPRLALALLSGLDPAALAHAIRGEQIAVLVGIPGIGRKTAERLIVELRDKVEIIGLDAAAPPPKTTPALPKSERFEDAVAALTGLGYTGAQAQDVLRRVSEGHEDLSLEALVRRSLALLTKAAVSAR
jgi:Holliday junction DNA helicase RuvA